MSTASVHAPNKYGDSMHAAHITSSLPNSLLMLLAMGTGLAVACIYYNQPMLAIIGHQLQASARLLGLVPTFTQIGYALGILLLAPLGDRYDRRRIILIKGGVLIGALLSAAFAPSIEVLLAASLAIGVAATITQDIVPAVATLAPESKRGAAVGKVMTGLLLGILLSRVISGFVAAHFDWRAMFLGAAASIALVWVAMWRMLPTFAPTSTLHYRALLASVGSLWQRYPALRRAAWAQGLLSLGFSAFWSMLAVMLNGAPFRMGSDVAGAFGLVGAAGALGAPLAGRIADRSGPDGVTRIGAVLVALSFAAMSLAGGLSVHAQLWVLGVGAVVFDLGVHASLIAHQSIVYGLEPAARSRLNAVLVVGMFVGMSAGSALASVLLAQFGWLGVTLLATVAAAAALGVRMWPAKRC